MGKRLVYIDRLKGFAIYLVVIGHVYQYFVNKGVDSKVFSMIYAFHMPMFFFLSGYLSEKTNKITSAKEGFFYLIKKSENLIVPLLSWALLNYFVFSEGTVLTFEAFLSVLTRQFIKPGLWFLLMLFKIFLTYVPFYLITQKERLKNKIILDFLVMIGTMVLVVLLSKLILGSNGLTFLLNYIFFMSGVVLTKYDLINTFVQKKIVYVLSIFCFLVFAFVYDFHNTVLIKMKFVKLIASFSAIITFYNLFKKITVFKIIDQFLTNIGKWTMVIYVTQFKFFSMLQPVLLTDKEYNFIVVFMLANILSILLVYICISVGWLVKKVYVLDFLLYGSVKKKTISK